MNSLFDKQENENIASVATLALRMRPKSLEEVVGQLDAVGPGSWLYSAIESDTLSSIILYGPAGTGKTSIAHVVANSTSSRFVEVSAIGGTVRDLRREIEAARNELAQNGMRTILFVDEIHRFNRAQQDTLLHAVENNEVTLIGATTENPYFEVNTALNSRCRIIQLKALGDKEISELLRRAIEDERGLAGGVTMNKGAEAAIMVLAGGDGRCALNILEIAASLSYANKDKLANVVTVENVQKASPERQLPYDKNKDIHYDIISAFIKSMRGSDPDAAVYWMARMLEGGEDPKFIARRIYILASEDIGNADPHALLVADAAFRAVEVIGMPECRINLAQAAIYMAMAPKSNACEAAIDAALSEVRHGPVRDVPAYLRDRRRPGAENYGEYKYPHDFDGGWVKQQYLPDGIKPGAFYQPSVRGWEARRSEYLREIKKK